MYQNISLSVNFFCQKQEKSSINDAAPHFPIHPTTLIRHPVCSIVFGSIRYHFRSWISFFIFSCQKEKSDHLSGSQSEGISIRREIRSRPALSCFWLPFVIVISFLYSLLSASIGFRFAAFTDGSKPKIIPMSMENTTEPTMAGTLMAVGDPATLETTLESPIPRTTPIMPPTLVRTAASVRN